MNCPLCNGEGIPLGVLVTTWYRCRNCGIQFMGDAVGVRVHVSGDDLWDDDDLTIDR